MPYRLPAFTRAEMLLTKGGFGLGDLLEELDTVFRLHEPRPDWPF